MDTTETKQAPAHTIIDLVRGSKAYQLQFFPKHRTNTVKIEQDIPFVLATTPPRHRKEASSPRHRLWDIEQS